MSNPSKAAKAAADAPDNVFVEATPQPSHMTSQQHSTANIKISESAVKDDDVSQQKKTPFKVLYPGLFLRWS